jgi:hypothetical protein
LRAVIPTTSLSLPPMVDIGLCPINEGTSVHFDILNDGN